MTRPPRAESCWAKSPLLSLILCRLLGLKYPVLIGSSLTVVLSLSISWLDACRASVHANDGRSSAARIRASHVVRLIIVCILLNKFDGAGRARTSRLLRK